jgi:hypothetical protein
MFILWQALGLWYERAWGRLTAIPDSTDKYKSTCSAVQQVQVGNARHKNADTALFHLLYNMLAIILILPL